MVDVAALSERGNGRTVREIITAAREGDERSRKAVSETGWWLGLGLASLSPLFSPDRIIVGGGIAAAGDLLLDSVRASYREHARPEFRDTTRVIGSTFGGWDGMVGAASLFLNPLA
jgi:glucokinase